MSRTRLVCLRTGVALLIPLRSGTGEVPADAMLLVGDRRVNLDRLPPALARLLPPAYAHASAREFEPLLRALMEGGS